MPCRHSTLCGPVYAAKRRAGPMIGRAGQAAQGALRVLAELGDPTALAVARRWVHDDTPQAHSARLAAIDALGWLQPPDAASLLREAIARPGSINGSWTKRMAAHALGRLGDIVALDRLLDDPDWFARLGAAEALAKLPPGARRGGPAAGPA